MVLAAGLLLQFDSFADADADANTGTTAVGPAAVPLTRKLDP